MKKRKKTLREKMAERARLRKGMVQVVILRSGPRGATGDITTRKAVKRIARERGWELRDGADGELEALTWWPEGKACLEAM